MGRQQKGRQKEANFFNFFSFGFGLAYVCLTSRLFLFALVLWKDLKVKAKERLGDAKSMFLRFWRKQVFFSKFKTNIFLRTEKSS